MFDIRKMQEQTLYRAVQSASDETVATQVVYGEDGEARAQSDAQWVCSAMARLEDRFDRPAVKKIRQGCQCGFGMEEKVTLVRELMAAHPTLEEFAACDRAREAGLSCRDGELFLQFPLCPCPMLAAVDKLNSDAWCQCTTGYSKVLFEQAFGCPVEVELLQSIKMGDPICLMKITPSQSVWGD